MPANLIPPLDDRSRLVMRNATKHATTLRHDEIAPEHILLGILDEGTGVTASMLRLIDRDFSVIRDNLNRHMLPGDALLRAKLRRSHSATQILEHAAYEALQAGARTVSPPYLSLIHI